MTRNDDGPQDGGSPASPPCLLHELDPAISGLTDAQTAIDVARWRRAERVRLIAARQAMPVSARRSADARLVAALTERLGALSDRTLGLYWPFRGEPDLRGWAADRRRDGARILLPVVLRKDAPLVFRLWTGEAVLERGVWNIPVPPLSAPEEVPDIVIAPVVGAGDGTYRLGYGGGFYDRTLAALRAAGRRPLVIGVGYAFQRIPTIFPQPHDVAMDETILVAD